MYIQRLFLVNNNRLSMLYAFFQRKIYIYIFIIDIETKRKKKTNRRNLSIGIEKREEPSSLVFSLSGHVGGGVFRNETRRPVGIEIFKSVEAFLLSIFFVRLGGRASWKGWSNGWWWIYHASRPSRRALNQAHNLAVVRLSRLSVSLGQPSSPPTP